MGITDRRYWLASRDRIRVVAGPLVGAVGTVSTVAGLASRNDQPHYHVELDGAGWATLAWDAMELVSRPTDSPRR
jgi:hypothetical protein